MVLLANTLQGRLRPGHVNAIMLAAYGAHTPEQLLALLKAHLQPGGLVPAALGGRVALAEGLIITRTSGAALGNRAPYRPNGCCPCCASP